MTFGGGYAMLPILQKELTEKRQKVWFINTDISDENSVKNTFSKIKEKDILILIDLKVLI